MFLWGKIVTFLFWFILFCLQCSLLIICGESNIYNLLFDNFIMYTLLSGVIPLHYLLFETEIISLPHKVFGYDTFVQDLYLWTLRNFFPQAIKGILVGYPQNQKGYCIYLSKTWKYVVSCDLTFFLIYSLLNFSFKCSFATHVYQLSSLNPYSQSFSHKNAKPCFGSHQSYFFVLKDTIPTAIFTKATDNMHL